MCSVQAREPLESGPICSQMKSIHNGLHQARGQTIRVDAGVNEFNAEFKLSNITEEFMLFLSDYKYILGYCL